MKIILASTSQSRKTQLTDLNLKFTIVPPGVDESIYKKQNIPFDKMCQQIARAKVINVAKKYPTSLVLGGDQMAVLDSTIFNKAYTAQKAIQNLMALQGRTHKLFTALYMKWGKKSFSHLETNVMQMRKLKLSQIKKYVKKAQPLECAGSYALERYGIALFEKINTADHSAIIGFPLITLINQLIKWKFPLPFL